jgi:hypothetical protein
MCRALPFSHARSVRRAIVRLLVLLALLSAWALLATAAFAATPDSYEPDGSYGTASPLTIGGPAQQHTISPEGDEDWVSIAVSAGTTYTIETGEGTPAESVDTVLSLYASDGVTLLEEDDDGGQGLYSRLTYTASADAMLFARVSSYSESQTGAYALTVTSEGSVDPPDADAFEPDGSFGLATPIAVDATPQQHTISPGFDEDWVSFPVNEGSTYIVDAVVDPASVGVYLELDLYDADGTTMLDWGSGLYYDETSWADGSAQVLYTADADETIYARVTTLHEETAGYALGVVLASDSFEPDNTSAAATPITVDGVSQQHDILPPSEQDWVSFPVVAGWRYTIETAPGTPPQETDTLLALYDADGTTLIQEDDDGADAGHYSRIVYDADVAKTVYVRVTAYYTDESTYALSVTGVAVPRIEVEESVDFGDVEVGESQTRTVLIRNAGVGPLAVGSIDLEGDGFSIVRDEAGGTTIAPGESAEVDVRFSPMSAYEGPPAPVEHDWTNVVAQYNYSGGVLVSITLFSGFQNQGGDGDLDWRVRIGAPQWTGTAGVVPGGRYTMRVVVNAGSGSFVEVLEPVSESFNVSLGGSTVLGVSYVRVPDASLTIACDDPDDPEAVIGLYGVAVPSGTADATPPTTSDDADDLWHNRAVTVHLTAADEPGGSGMSGGLAKTEYSKDGGASWTVGTAVSYAVWRRGGGSGLHTLLYRSTDAAGNTEETKSCEVRIDARPPSTTDDAPTEPQAGPLTVHLSALDSTSGVAACSGVAATWYALDGGAWTEGTAVAVAGAGLHWIAYFSIDLAGNVEQAHWCPVTILAAARSAGRPAHRASRPGVEAALRRSTIR